MMNSETFQQILAHLGGKAVFADLGVHAVAADDSHVSFQFFRPNRRNVRTVAIALLPSGLYRMTCFGRLIPGTFTAPKLYEANDIIAENLATVLGQLTGVEWLHHRHF